MTEVSAIVRGAISFPDHPDHQGAGGLLGAEDISAQRTTFRSVGEAMTWARKVLDGQVGPRWNPLGPPPTTGRIMGPLWSEAVVSWTAPAADPEQEPERLTWVARAGDRNWHEVVYLDGGGTKHGDVARADPQPEEG